MNPVPALGTFPPPKHTADRLSGVSSLAQHPPANNLCIHPASSYDPQRGPPGKPILVQRLTFRAPRLWSSHKCEFVYCCHWRSAHELLPRTVHPCGDRLCLHRLLFVAPYNPLPLLAQLPRMRPIYSEMALAGMSLRLPIFTLSSLFSRINRYNVHLLIRNCSHASTTENSVWPLLFSLSCSMLPVSPFFFEQV
jgi:hypothetical protein